MRIDSEDLNRLTSLSSKFLDKTVAFGTACQIWAEDGCCWARTSNYQADILLGVPSEGDLERTVVSLKLFDAVAQSFDEGWVDFKVGKRLLLSQGSQRRFLNLLDPEIFPEIITEEFENLNPIDLRGFIQACKRVSFATSRDVVRPLLGGIQITNGNVIAADGLRVAQADHKIEPEETSVFPLILVDVLSGLESFTEEKDFKYAVNGRWFFIGDSQGSAYVSAIAGKHPASPEMVERIRGGAFSTTFGIPKDSKLSRILKLAVVCADEAKTQSLSESTRLFCQDGKVVLEMAVPEVIELHEELDMDYQGDDLVVKFHPRHFLEILDQKEDLTVSLSEPFKPFLIEGKDWRVIQTPMGGREEIEKWKEEREKLTDVDKGGF